MEEIRVPRENHWSAASHWQTLSHNVVSSTPHHEQGSIGIHHKHNWKDKKKSTRQGFLTRKLNNCPWGQRKIILECDTSFREDVSTCQISWAYVYKDNSLLMGRNQTHKTLLVMKTDYISGCWEGGHSGRDHMVDGFVTTKAMSAMPTNVASSNPTHVLDTTLCDPNP